MPATLTSITSKRANIEVPLDKTNPDGPKVKVTYRPKWFNKSVQNTINDLAIGRNGEQTVAADLVISVITSCVVAWDLYAEDGDPEPIPLTDEGLSVVPTEFLSEIVLAITADQNPDPPTGQ